AGNSIQVNSVALDPVLKNTVDIYFNGNVPPPSPPNVTNPLVAETYTLFLRGDQVHDTDDGLPVALPGALVTANTGNNTVSFVNSFPGGTVGAVGNYADPVNATSAPTAVAFGDLSGATTTNSLGATVNIPDLVVVNGGNDTVSIY